MYVFGVNLPILELLVVLSLVVVLYLVLLELEFRQLRKIQEAEQSSESLLRTEIQDLKSEIQELKDILEPKPRRHL